MWFDLDRTGEAMSTTVGRIGRGELLIGAGAAALVAGALLIWPWTLMDNDYRSAWGTVCKGSQAPEPEMSPAELPLGLVSTALLVLAVVLLVLAFRRLAGRGLRVLAGALLIAGILGTVLAGAFLLVGVILRIDAGPVDCFG
ncbi:hypothetical protein Acy02nite_16160 [Actinoplanes cyaneus]|uniref:Uncharacterized protein n=1 Tax=Actinoplanes cyaneus TaxID=52696 RepID=A0A919ICV9_9ACTN|nr:hypothetical protein [Actinoplanes cyaneus]MCW2142108.1 hypothetical protein [Actinoplanes cyaneus]GID63735.1 hypothetical protein Acy02nite_16160 [Actinoplanes cyaneus]